jgi:hypothetical protein
MLGACRVIDNACAVKVIGDMALLCKKMKNACGVIDTACKI